MNTHLNDAAPGCHLCYRSAPLWPGLLGHVGVAFSRVSIWGFLLDFLSLGALSSCFIDVLLILILFHFGFLRFVSLYKHAFVLEICLRKYVNDGQCIKQTAILRLRMVLNYEWFRLAFSPLTLPGCMADSLISCAIIRFLLWMMGGLADYSLSKSTQGSRTACPRKYGRWLHHRQERAFIVYFCHVWAILPRARLCSALLCVCVCVCISDGDSTVFLAVQCVCEWVGVFRQCV